MALRAEQGTLSTPWGYRGIPKLYIKLKYDFELEENNMLNDDKNIFPQSAQIKTLFKSYLVSPWLNSIYRTYLG